MRQSPRNFTRSLRLGENEGGGKKMQIPVLIALCGLVSVTVAAPLTSEEGQKGPRKCPFAVV